MGNRRFNQVWSDEEEEYNSNEDSSPNRTKRQRIRFPDENEVSHTRESSQTSDDDDDDDDTSLDDAKPIGDILKVTGKGRNRRTHFSSFDIDGNRFDLEDPVLLTPEHAKQKPYVAIIKDISQIKDGSMMVCGQWFYRPEEAEKKSGGNWQSRDTRELFYSFHRDEVPAESVMHKCVVHFIPLNKEIPNRKKHPGFIVQKVYDTIAMKLFKLTDKDYEDNKQQEIDLLVQKTRGCLGELPDIHSEVASGDDKDPKNKIIMRKRNIAPLDVTRNDEITTRHDQNIKAETPGSCTSSFSEYYGILSKFKALTGETQRDKWLERLLHGVQFVRGGSGDHVPIIGQVKGGSGETGGETNGIDKTDDSSFLWPDDFLPAVVALENAAHVSFALDFQKYNQKMRQLVFNLKNNALLSRRLVKGELEPTKIMNMSPTELKEGLTAEETPSKEPEEAAGMQMTNARCSRCAEKKVGLMDIIRAGFGDRYQLECRACGNMWYASRDEAAVLMIDDPISIERVETMVIPSNNNADGDGDGDADAGRSCSNSSGGECAAY